MATVSRIATMDVPMIRIRQLPEFAAAGLLKPIPIPMELRTALMSAIPILSRRNRVSVVVV
jgi:hypothetical protein